MNLFHLVRRKLSLPFSNIFSDAGRNGEIETAHERQPGGVNRNEERRRATKRDRILYYAQIFSEGVEDRRKNFLDRRTG